MPAKRKISEISPDDSVSNIGGPRKRATITTFSAKASPAGLTSQPTDGDKSCGRCGTDVDVLQYTQPTLGTVEDDDEVEQQSSGSKSKKVKAADDKAGATNWT